MPSQPLPLRLASRAFTRVFMQPGGGPGDEKLREAVEGKVVLVTGASFGIGEASALELGEAGARVLLVARTAKRLEVLAERISELGGRAYVHTCDVGQPDAVEELAAEVLEEYGHIDVLVSNAGKSSGLDRLSSPSHFGAIDINTSDRACLASPLREREARLDARRADAADPALGGLPGLEGSLRHLAAKRRPGVAARRRQLHLDLPGAGAHADERAHPEPAQHAWTEPGAGGRPGLRAVVERPREIQPWWVSLAAPSFEFARGPWERVNELAYRLTADSSASSKAARNTPEPNERARAAQAS